MKDLCDPIGYLLLRDPITEIQVVIVAGENACMEIVFPGFVEPALYVVYTLNRAIAILLAVEYIDRKVQSRQAIFVCFKREMFLEPRN